MLPGVVSVETWAQDEARLGLQPVLRRVWAPRGVRPIAWVNPRYEWLWVYGFVHPPTGETYWLTMPGVNVAAMGPEVEAGWRRFVFRPFQTSTTFRNLKATGEGVLHVVDDP